MAKEHAFDVRTLERNLEKGNITRAEYDKHLGTLDDVEANSIPFQAEFVEGVFDRAAASRKAAAARADEGYDDLSSDEEE